MTKTDCRRCDHPASHHEAGECWTDGQGREIWNHAVDECKCAWYEASEEGEQ